MVRRVRKKSGENELVESGYAVDAPRDDEGTDNPDESVKDEQEQSEFIQGDSYSDEKASDTVTQDACSISMTDYRKMTEYMNALMRIEELWIKGRKEAVVKELNARCGIKPRIVKITTYDRPRILRSMETVSAQIRRNNPGNSEAVVCFDAVLSYFRNTAPQMQPKE